MAFNFTFPKLDESVLENGMRLILLPDHEQEGLVAAVQFPFGRFCDPVLKEGLTEMAIALVQKGTDNCPFDQFSEKLEFSGASVFAEVGEEHTGLGIRMLSKSKDELIPLFLDMLLNPRMDRHEFDRIKKEMITSLQAETIEPSIIANRHFFVELAGKDHPAGRFHSIEATRSLKLDEVKKYYSEYVGPQNAIFVVAGDFDLEEFKEKYLSILTLWKTECKGRSCFAPAVASSKTAFRLIDKSDTTQTTLVIGHSMPGELVKERTAIALANYILGGGNFSSRLMTSIRSKVGHTYGISSQIAAERTFGAFTISTSTQNSQLRQMIDAVLEQLRDFCLNGVTTEELENAKRFAIGNMTFQLEGIGNIAEKLLWLRFYDYGNEYIEHFDQRIEKITLENINNTIKEYFSPDKLIIAAVGKKTEIVNQLSGLGTIKQFHFRDKV